MNFPYQLDNSQFQTLGINQVNSNLNQADNAVDHSLNVIEIKNQMSAVNIHQQKNPQPNLADHFNKLDLTSHASDVNNLTVQMNDLHVYRPSYLV
jgi:hypothetical protein